jgi:hypothetical protein
MEKQPRKVFGLLGLPEKFISLLAGMSQNTDGHRVRWDVALRRAEP